MALDSHAYAASSEKARSPEPSLASRGDCLLANLVDGAVALVVVVPLELWTGELTAAFHGRPVTGSTYLVTIAAGWGWYFLANGYFLKKHGQTLGKRFLGIRVSDCKTEAVPTFWRLIVRIGLPSLFGLLIPLGGAFYLADDLFIFRNDRRCIHDCIVGTHVVEV